MSSTYEKDLLKWHATGQAALVDVQKGAVRKIGQPAMIRRLTLRPDAKYVRVTRMLEPFLYDVPVSSFGSIEEIWDPEGKVLAKVTDRPINLGVQDDTRRRRRRIPARWRRRGGNQNQTGKRELAWRADGQGLTYLEQEPAPQGAGGRARGNAPVARQRPVQATTRRTTPRVAAAAQQAQRKDRLYQWLPPFDEAAASCSSRTTRA